MMSDNERKTILEELAKDGYELLIHSQHHIQIPNGKKVGKHNIWFTKNGLRFQVAGSGKGILVSVKELKEKLEKHDAVKTDLDMQETITFIKKSPIKEGIFVDASFKDGKARAAIIRIQSNGDIDVHIRNFDCNSANEAEEVGILMAIRLFPGDEIIYSDSEIAVAKNQPRAKWLSRKQNKVADILTKIGGLPKGKVNN